MGSGLALDTDRYFYWLERIRWLQGTTGPSSINPQTGKPYGSQFPNIVVQDIVKSTKSLNIVVLIFKAIIGGSFGGMQADQWAIDYPDFMDNIVNLCSSIYFSAEAAGFNHRNASSGH